MMALSPFLLLPSKALRYLNSRFPTPLTLLISASLMLLYGCREASDPLSAAATGSAAQGLPVEIIRVAPRDLSRRITVSAPVQALRQIELASQMSGVVTALNVEEGDAVTEGSVLATLDVREVRAELTRARVLLSEQQVNLDRLEKLRERGYIDEASLSIAQTQAAVARADVGLWETRLSFGSVRSPINGVVTARYVEPGEAVSQYAPLLSLADFDRLVVRFGLSERDVAGLAAGDAVAVRIDALTQDPLIDGEVRRIMPATEGASRLVTVEVQLPQDARERLRIGYLARATLTVDDRPEVLAVPISAVGIKDQDHYVMVVDDQQRLQRRAVTLGVTRGSWHEVKEGLAPGEAVITSSPADLSDGEPVRVVREVDGA